MVGNSARKTLAALDALKLSPWARSSIGAIGQALLAEREDRRAEVEACRAYIATSFGGDAVKATLSQLF